MIPPGLAFLSISVKAWARMDTAKLPRCYSNLKKEKTAAAADQSAWTPNIALMLALAESLKYIKELGMANLVENAQQLAHATRLAAQALGLELFAADSPGSSFTSIQA